MKIKLLHLYPEAMSLYGEYANLTLLSRYLTWRGAEVEVKAVGCDEAPDFTGADLIYMGAGTERTQKAALGWLTPYKDALKEAAEGSLVLFTGNAMELLGDSITDQKGTVYEGLGFGGFATVETDKRVPHDAIAKTDLFPEPVVGFMNKCSHTSGVETPIFEAMTMGMGNEKEGGPEGFRRGNVVGTHITGPVLVKNPAFLAWIAERILENRGETLPVPANKPDWLIHAEKAYQVTLEELSALANK